MDIPNSAPGARPLSTHTVDSTTIISTAETNENLEYYHAGPLFTLAELHTNSLLAKAIKTQSSERYIPILPQDLEQRGTSPKSIRDQDIRALLSCDMALFTYDGTELDAGTVVEYMIAKMADIPSVILRTDFRGAGDQAGAGDPWNLMTSFWPRTKTVILDSITGYKEGLSRILKEENVKGLAGEYAIEETARKVIAAFDEVRNEPSRLPAELRKSVYEWLALMPGLKDGSDQTNIEMLTKLCDIKVEKGLL